MYYEDENNLYHYSYRKGDVVEPVYNTRNFADDPVVSEQKLEKKKHRGAGFVALMLVCGLIGGAVGAGAGGAIRTSAKGLFGEKDEASTAIEVSERTVADVKTVAVNGMQKLTFPELYKANINSVVSINTTITTNVFNQTVQNASAGSGFIITTDGYIVTNYHVIDKASEVKVTLYNGKTYDATIIGGDSDYDIAVLKIDAADLDAVTFGDSSKLQVGEDIAAIGNPLGQLTFSMSEGIVSSVDRAINVDGTPFNMIQVTAAINPGNSGGPLFNSYGEVVGIVSAKYSSYASSSVEGLGFAIPINDVIAMVEDIMENGRVTNRPYLGMMAGSVTPNYARQNGLAVDYGVLVSAVEDGGAAAKAGLRAGDVIVKIGEQKVESMSDLNAVKKSYKAGDTVTVTINRGGTEQQLSLTFDAAPEKTQTEEQQPQQNQNNNGGYYYDPWDFFNEFFGNAYGGGNYYGSSYNADDAA
jgi:serine protease Do